jgi:CBS domain-containing protein
MSIGSRRVSEIMQEEVVTLGADDRLDLADDIMRLGRVRHIPVLREGRVVGVVTARDLLAASLSKTLEFDPQQRRTFMRSVDVGEVMSAEPVTVGAEDSLAEAARRMVGRKIGCLPVVAEDGSLVGLVTETDLLRVALLADDDEEEETPGAVHEIERRFAEEIATLRRLRDELRVQIHLGRAEAKERWDALEHRWSDVEAKLRLVRREAGEPLHDVRGALRGLLREIRDGYRHIKDAL